jgi:eukaryotic-like serine/threonine-protein kinase
MPGTVRMDPSSDDEADPGASSAPAEDKKPAVVHQAGDADKSILLSSSDVTLEDAPEQAESPRAAALVGKLVGGRYRVEALIGTGGFGAVYRAEHVRMRKRVALKVLSADAERLPEIVTRFEREAVCGAHVQHPNVASATDFGQLDDGSFYLALEYVDGERLSDLINRGPLPPERAARIARDIASALAAVHEKGIVHRDVKPENVMMTPSDRVKLIDFGLAKIKPELINEVAKTNAGIQLTAVGAIVGTVAYLAPEAALGMDAVDERGDLYALGLVLFEMLSGKRPFEGHDNVSLFRHQRFSPPPRIAERAPGVEVPAALEAIALRLLAKNPADRFASAPAVVRAFEALVGPADERPAVSRAPIESTPSIPGLPRGPRSKPRAEPSTTAAVVQIAGKLPFWARAAIGGVAIVVVAITVAALNARSHAPLPAGSVSAEGTVPEVTPQVAPPPTAPPRVDGVDATGWRARLRNAVDSKDWASGTRAFLALAEIDAPAFDEPGLRGDVVAVAAGIAFEGNELADRMFDAMANKLGSRGPDLLFEVVRSRGATRAAHRAIDLLHRPEVIGRATPAMRLAFDLKMAPCDQKTKFFEPAVKDGDARSLVQLEVLKDQPCKKKDPCCFRENKALVDAIQKMRLRLSR